MKRSPGLALWATLSMLGCASTRAVAPAEQYAHALETDQLDAAYALTTQAFQSEVSLAQFRTRFSDPAARSARAAAVREGLAELAEAAPELFGKDATEPPEAVILHFATAIRAGRFDEGWRCLSATLRQRYSVEALAQDFRAEPGASARLERAVLAAEGIPVKAGDTVRFPVPGGGAVVVVREGDGWKLQALE
jgi:hypothetical protein